MVVQLNSLQLAYTLADFMFGLLLPLCLTTERSARGHRTVAFHRMVGNIAVKSVSPDVVIRDFLVVVATTW